MRGVQNINKTHTSLKKQVMFFLTPSTGVNVGQILSASLFVVVSVVVVVSSDFTGALVVC